MLSSLHRFNKSNRQVPFSNCYLLCDPGEIRTLDPYIKSVMRYQLCHEVFVWAIPDLNR